jgi:IclR family transcriptional regulator, KDG regulon repressor
MKRDDQPRQEPFYNRSLERALQILIAFTGDRSELSLGQIADMLDLSKATILRLCSTLVKFGFLGQEQESKKYHLGLKLFELGSFVFSSLSLTRVASPRLTELESKLGKTVFLGILEDGDLLYVDKREGAKDGIRFTSSIGKRRPPYWGMLGPVLMAYLPENEIDRLLARNPLVATARKSFTTIGQYKEWLLQIREQGYVVEDETAFEGIGGVAAAIRDFTGNVIAAVGVGFIASSVDAKGLKKIIKEVAETAHHISKELGHTGRLGQG